MIPPKGNAAFAARAEDVPDLHAGSRGPPRPVARAGGAGEQRVGDARPPPPLRPGSPPKADGRSVRGGAANLFPASEARTKLRPLHPTVELQ